MVNGPTLRARDRMIYLWISIFMLVIDRGEWITAS
jgi:hypothetical protein